VSHLVLTEPRQYGGVIVLTGGFIGPDPIKPTAAGSPDGVPVILRSIEENGWVPSHRVKESAALFEGAGAQVDLLIEPGTEHIVTAESCVAAARLLSAIG
jgi:phospholipase/carboxylesterase